MTIRILNMAFRRRYGNSEEQNDGSQRNAAFRLGDIELRHGRNRVPDAKIRFTHIWEFSPSEIQKGRHVNG